MFDNLVQITPTPRDQKGTSLIRIYDPFDNNMIQQEFAGVVALDGNAGSPAEEDVQVVSKVEKVGDEYRITAPWGETRRPTTALNSLRIIFSQRETCYFWSVWGDELDFHGEAKIKDWEKCCAKYSQPGESEVSKELSDIGETLWRILNLIHDLSDSVAGTEFLASQDVTSEDAVVLEKVAASYKEAACKPTPAGPGRLGG